MTSSVPLSRQSSSTLRRAAMHLCAHLLDLTESAGPESVIHPPTGMDKQSVLCPPAAPHRDSLWLRPRPQTCSVDSLLCDVRKRVVNASHPLPVRTFLHVCTSLDSLEHFVLLQGFTKRIFEGSHNFILHLISLEEHRPRLFVDLCIIKLPILPSHDQVTVTDPDDRDRSDSH